MQRREKPLPRSDRVAEPVLDLKVKSGGARVKAREDKRRAKRDRKARELTERLGDVSSPFWVYESTHHHSTKIHSAHCVNCNNGKGKGLKGDTKSGRWFGFASLEEARVGAESCQPDRHSICHMCLGSYRLRGP